MSERVIAELIITGALIASGIIMAVIIDLIKYRGLRYSDKITKFIASFILGILSVGIFCLVMCFTCDFDVKLQHVFVYVLSIVVVDRCIIKIKFSMNKKKK